MIKVPQSQVLGAAAAGDRMMQRQGALPSGLKGPLAIAWLEALQMRKTDLCATPLA